MHGKRALLMIFLWSYSAVTRNTRYLSFLRCFVFILKQSIQLTSDTISIDRKIRFCVSPRTNLALKVLREQLGNLLAHQYQGKSLDNIQNSWKDIGLLALGRMKIKPDDNTQPPK
jgi:hypothetical protein